MELPHRLNIPPTPRPPRSIYLQRAVEQHEHKCTFLHRAHLRGALTERLAAGLEEAGVQATVIEGAAGAARRAVWGARRDCCRARARRAPPQLQAASRGETHSPHCTHACAHVRAAEAGWRFVDLLPAGAGKGAAMEWVRARLGFAREHTVAAGDGANDLLMLQHDAAGAAICVGNSQPEVVAWAQQQQQVGDGGGGVGGRRVHLAARGSHAAAGVLEGLAALGFLA